ncbi:tRNA pseudouridine(13) synthase TruD [archaeon]|nr:tRNA pseudouridine(13) synthase TruD [archaeon]
MYEIKREPQDFLVEEITPDGKVLEFGKKQRFREGKGDQLICVLEKKDWDTLLAIRRVCEALRISPKRIGFAGTKDKRCWSAQRISIWNAKNEEVNKLHLKDISLKPLTQAKERVELGHLKGNRFTVKVYSGKPPKKRSLVWNYFGVQRFGETRPITHLVGKALVKGSIEDAVKIYLAETSLREKDDALEARKRLASSWDYKAALEFFPRRLGFERTLLAHLAEQPNDYAGALRKLPKNLKLMFVHAYQALLFNAFVDEVRKRKTKVKEGALIGYESHLTPAERKLLAREGVMLEDFRVLSMPECGSRGEHRELKVKLDGFKVLKKGKGWYIVRFSLPKGSYATVALDQLFGQQ